MLPEIQSFTPAISISFETFPREHLDNLIARRDYGTILKIKELFWLLYCNSYKEVFSVPSADFYVTGEAHFLVVHGRAYVITELKKTIEEIRKYVLQGYQHSQNVRMIAFVAMSINVYIRKDAGEIDLRNWLSQRKFRINKEWFSSYIQPCLAKLFESISASCVISTQNRNVNTGSEILEREVDILEVEWNKKRVYPIAPLKLSEGESAREAAYKLYKDKKLLDVTLQGSDGKVSLHALMLYIYGGEVIQRMLAGFMKETRTRRISFKEFPQSVLQAFVDFLYLGPKAFLESFNAKPCCDAFLLFEFAHTYQVPDFIACATNAISLIASPKDLGRLERAVLLTENEHLGQLATHLAPKIKRSKKKVRTLSVQKPATLSKIKRLCLSSQFCSRSHRHHKYPYLLHLPHRIGF